MRVKTVLCIDDEPSLLEVLASLFEREGLRVFTARDGNEGLAEYLKRRDQIELIISDVRMPEVDGVELLKKVREIDFNVPFVLMSGFTDYSEVTLRRLGATAFLQKPFDRTFS